MEESTDNETKVSDGCEYYCLRDQSEVDSKAIQDLQEADVESSCCLELFKILGVWIVAIVYSGAFAFGLHYYVTYAYLRK